MVSKSQYGEREVKACKSVLIEIVRILGEIKDEVVIIGGWAPVFILPQFDDPHVGSLDIDVALNFSKISNGTYQTILNTFFKHGYSQNEKQLFRFFRKVQITKEESVDVEVDLMAGEYGGTGKGHRTQKIQDIQARKARGCDLAFGASVNVMLEGELPDGGKDKVSFKVAGIVPFLVMKGMAMYERMKEKDAYDIFYCVEHYPGGVKKLAAQFRPYATNKLVNEGLGKIKNKFASVEYAGPKWVADFLEIVEKEERDIIIRRAYEKISELLDILGISMWEEKIGDGG